VPNQEAAVGGAEAGVEPEAEYLSIDISQHYPSLQRQRDWRQRTAGSGEGLVLRRSDGRGRFRVVRSAETENLPSIEEVVQSNRGRSA
jgi:hypothetical protein